jgi:hypothetical protein
MRGALLAPPWADGEDGGLKVGEAVSNGDEVSKLTGSVAPKERMKQ